MKDLINTLVFTILLLSVVTATLTLFSHNTTQVKAGIIDTVQHNYLEEL